MLNIAYGNGIVDISVESLMHALVHAWGELGNKINSKVFECKYSAGFVCIVTSAWLQLLNIHQTGQNLYIWASIKPPCNLLKIHL